MAKSASKPPKSATRASAKSKLPARPTAATKVDRIIAALRTAKGASIPDLMTLTGWQAHSVRGALSGALKKERGLKIVSQKRGAERIYRIEG